MTDSPPDGVPPQETANGKPPKRKRLLGLSAGLLVLVLGACCAVTAILTVLGINEYNLSPKLVTLDEPVDYQPYGVAYSDDQQAVLDEHGAPPDQFVILFYGEDLPTVEFYETRVETWTYTWACQEYTFVDGALQDTAELPCDWEAEIFPAPYQPKDFAAYMPLDNVLSVTQLEEYVVVPLEDDLVEGGELYYGDQLAFGMKDNHLIYVETVAFAQ